MNIKIENGSIGYRRSKVLADIDLQIESSHIHCIFGRNGSGKTTLLKSMAGIIPILEGRITYGETALGNISVSKRAKMFSLVLTARPIVSGMSVIDFVKFGRYPYTNWLGINSAEDELRISQSISDCGISVLQQRDINELSDGEMQKVQLARALAQDCPIIFLDEPVAHLDLVNKAEIFKLIKKINKQGRTILFTSHDLQFSMQLADYFTVIHENKLETMYKKKFLTEKVFEKVLAHDSLLIDSINNSIVFKD